MRSPVLIIAAAAILTASGVRLWGLIEYAHHASEPDDPVVEVLKLLRRDLAQGVCLSDPEAADPLVSSAEISVDPDDARSSPAATSGSLIYREGPMSDVSGGPSELPFGDTDDQLSILIAAEQGESFTATVPWGVLEAVRANLLGPDYSLPADYDPSAPRTITSEFAAIVYSTTPVDSAGKLSAPRSLGRRVFLFRPDFQVTAAGLTAAGRPHKGFSATTPDQPVFGFLREDGIIEPYRPTDADPMLLATNELLVDRVLAFDLQRFDADVPIFIHAGADGEPGAAGFDDDGNGVFDHPPDHPREKDRGEFGAVGSDDQTVSPADGAMYQLCRRGAEPAIVIARGSYIDDFAASVGESLGVSATEAGESPDPMRPDPMRIVIRYLEAKTGTPRQVELLGP